MEELFGTLLQAILAVAVPILTGFCVRFISKRTEEAAEAAKNEIAARHISQIGDAVTTTVAYISQTFVDDLKKSHKLTREDQEEAMSRAITLAKSLLTSEAARFIDEVYGDMSKFLAAKIEAEIKLQRID